MQEAAGASEGVAVMTVADPRQVFTLLLAPLSTPYGGGGEGLADGRLPP